MKSNSISVLNCPGKSSDMTARKISVIWTVLWKKAILFNHDDICKERKNEGHTKQTI